jgi:hypothetical protein
VFVCGERHPHMHDRHAGRQSGTSQAASPVEQPVDL